MRKVDRKFYEKIKERSHGYSSIIENEINVRNNGFGEEAVDMWQAFK